ncbi:MAG: hypothetical protein KFB93_05425 [Simkaniaceae bacterium]|nr:MAG: hypothetical protein KFB93_05425 [Simkaniaceae bacterium]
MSDGTRIEGSSHNTTAVSTFSEDAKKVKNSSLHPLTTGEQGRTDATAQASDRTSEQAQVEVAKSRKTYEGTNIKARNPIIVTMLIMQVVTEALKDSADKTKEVTKIEKRIWKHHSDGQSENYKQGEKCQQWMMGGKGAKMALDLAATRFKGQNLPIFNFDAETSLSGLGTLSGGFADSVFPQEQQRIQIEDAKFQYKVGHTGSDYQNQSQQVSSDNQMVDSAREKSIQLGRLMVQLITAQPA